MSQTLVDLDRDLRTRFPKIFEKVDAIKARPGWTPFSHEQGYWPRATGTGFSWKECPWCGDDFVAASPRTKYCSQRCSGLNQSYWARRAA